MISKIIDIEGKSFEANAPDYMYKKYLELPFDFTIQAISGTDLNKIRRVFINNIKLLVELQELVGEFIIGTDLYLPEQIESIIDSTIVIYDGYIE